ncbi:MAG: Na(+)-translocating NADH-quinone reductase subunit A [Bacteroidales bacterium]|nr:Na(+)-translocating NADH-quinone reductase subunit A [Bacteroidales bacterium]
MSKTIKLRKGFDINMQGVAEHIFVQNPMPDSVALKPTDFVGLTAKLMVKEGDKVLAGDPLFINKLQPEVKFTSPVSGTVSAVTRGERRALLNITVTPDKETEYKKFDVADLDSMSREQVVSAMLEAGVWPFVKQRPYDVVANPNDKPKSIFVSAFDTAPLAPDYTFALEESADDFQVGMNALRKLTDGAVNLNIYKEGRAKTTFTNITGVEQNFFSGKHPVGNVGVQIHHIDPINKGDIVWVVNPQDVVIIGRLFSKGVFDARVVVALTGAVKSPRYYKTILGANIQSLLAQEQLGDNMRIISGNVLTGTKLGANDFIGYYDSQVTVIEEGNKPTFMGWLAPGFDKYSFRLAFFSWLSPKKKYTLNTNTNGGKRAFVFTGIYEDVLPMDIYPMQLIKAIMAEDVDKMEQLGIYEVVPEDLAICEFVCPSKIEMQSILRQGLNVMRKEFN